MTMSGARARGMGTLPPRLPSAAHISSRSSSRSGHQQSSQGEWGTIESLVYDTHEPRSSSRGRQHSSREYSADRPRSSSRGRQNIARDRSTERSRASSKSGHRRGHSSEARQISRSSNHSRRERSLERSRNEPKRRTRSKSRSSQPTEQYILEDTFKPRCRSRSASLTRRSKSSKKSAKASSEKSVRKPSQNDVSAEHNSYEPRRRRSKSASRRGRSSRGPSHNGSEEFSDEVPPPRNPDFASFAFEAGDGSTAAAQWGRRDEEESTFASFAFEAGDGSTAAAQRGRRDEEESTNNDDNDRYVTTLEIEIPTGDARPDEDRYDFSPFKSAPTCTSSGPVDPWASPEAQTFSVGGTPISIEDCEGVPYIRPHPCDDGYASGSDPSGVTTIDTFLTGTDIHPNMIQSDEDVAQLRLFAGKLSADWGGNNLMAPALARRIRDFQYAQDKRRKKYGDERPWGILGLYDHLSGIRVDVEWAEDAAWRRSNGEPYLSWSDFEASKKKGINRPFFTYFILFACTIIMIVSIGVNGWKVEPFDENPMIGPSAETLIKMGAKDSYLIVYQNESWRLVSSIVLHAGIIHFFVNMIALWFVGAAIETSHGFIATTMVFIIPAVGGTILSAIFLPEYITVGASGGIFGLIGACLADILVNWKLLFNDFVTENGKKHHHALVLVFLILDIILNSIIGLTPYVDNFTHLGGMAYGFLCGISTMERVSSDFFGLSEGFWRKTKHVVVRFFGLIVSLIVIVATLVVLLEGDGRTTPCPNCTWLSCVPFPPWEGETEKWWYCDDCGRVTAEIVTTPDLRLALNCPNGVTVDVPLEEKDTSDTKKIEKALPSYCREYCPDINVRF